MCENNRYKSAKDVIQMLIDGVSKNGNLLLNVPVRGDGPIDEKEIAVVEGIAIWLDINEENIFDTQPWKVFGEGPSAETSNLINAQVFNEGEMKFSAKDIRFNQNGDILYITVMGAPTEDIVIKNLGTSKNGKINKTSLLGSKEVLKWKQEAEFLKIQKPGTVPNSIAIVFKVYQK